MGKILLSAFTAAGFVGSLFYISFKEVNASGAYLENTIVETKVQASSVQHVITAHTKVGDGSDFTPMWSRGEYVQIVANPQEDKSQEEDKERKPEKEGKVFADNTEKRQEVVEPEYTRAVQKKTLEEVSEKEIPVLPSVFQAIRDEIQSLTNQERVKHNLASLTFDTQLSALAGSHSEDLVKRDYFAHEDPDGCGMTCRFQKSEYKAVAWAENIAQLKKSHLLTDKEIASHIVESWMESDSHRQNILNSAYTHQGIGIAQDGDTLYVTVEFALPQ